MAYHPVKCYAAPLWLRRAAWLRAMGCLCARERSGCEPLIKQPKASASTIEERENRADVLPQKPGSLPRRKVVVKVP